VTSDWQIIGFTLRAALSSTLLILPLGLLAAWLVARRLWPGKIAFETLVTLPLVLPPVVTGLLLLRLFGKRGPVGAWLHQNLGVDVVFTWRAVILALGVMSFPLLVRSARTAFEQVNPRYENLARTLGAGELGVFFRVSLPLASRGVIAGFLLAFARALGEFGATIMVAGNIPGETSTLSLAIFQSVQNGRDNEAVPLLVASVVLAFAAVWASEWLLRRAPKGK